MRQGAGKTPEQRGHDRAPHIRRPKHTEPAVRYPSRFGGPIQRAAGAVASLKSGDNNSQTNAAFKLLTDGTVETLLKPENKKMLTSVLTYHVVSDRYDANALMHLIHQRHGQVSLKTVNGANLTLVMNGDPEHHLRDAKGTQANIAVYDVYQSNGVILVIDKVLLPA